MTQNIWTPYAIGRATGLLAAGLKRPMDDAWRQALERADTSMTST